MTSYHNSSQHALTNQRGTIVWQASAQPFAAGTPNTDPDRNGIHITFNLRYPGQYFDVFIENSFASIIQEFSTFEPHCF